MSRRPWHNPVLRRELLERWRGRRAFVVITVYVGLLAGLMWLLWWIGNASLTDRMRWGGFDAVAAGPALGRFLFENLLSIVLLLVLFITPGYAAAQISGERERKTLGLLQITLIRPWEIVAGKLGSSIAWLLLLVVTSLPFAATAFLLGGVSLADLVRGFTLVILVAVSIAGIGVGISSLTRKTTAAVVLTYATVLTLLIGTLFASVVEAALRGFDFGPDDRPVAMYLNPYYGLADAARADRFEFIGGVLPSVLTPFAHALPEPRTAFRELSVDERGAVLQQVTVEERALRERAAVVSGRVRGEPGWAGEPAARAIPEQAAIGRPVPAGEVMPMPVPVPAPGEFGEPVEQRRSPVWLITLGAHLLLGALGFTVATRRVRPENTPARLRRGRNEDQDDQDDQDGPGRQPDGALGRQT